MANETMSRKEVIRMVGDLIVQLEKCEYETKKIRCCLDSVRSKLRGHRDSDVGKSGRCDECSFCVEKSTYRVCVRFPPKIKVVNCLDTCGEFVRKPGY